MSPGRTVGYPLPMGSLGYVRHASFLEHDPGEGHPERAARVAAIEERLGGAGLLAELDVLEPRTARREELEAVHDPALVRRVEEACARAPASLDADTAVSGGSLEAALRAAGGALEAAERIVDGTWSRAFCAVRPPGHHAERHRPMGFCLFNNVAVAARALVQTHGLERVAVVDFDVHHGNGTQDVFAEDPRVFYASLHQWPLSPGTGAADERGRGEGEGTTLNAPLPLGADDAAWQRALEERVLPAVEAFAPEVLLLSAGFDAHRDDPLAGTRLTEDGYRSMTTALVEVAERTAGGRVVSVLEGGYRLEALARSVEAHLEALVGGGV